VGEEKPEELLEPLRIIDRATHHFPAVLDKHSFEGILENDVVLRVTTTEFFLDFLVEIVVLVLRLPITKWDTQLME
jgi:hypothetical protein